MEESDQFDMERSILPKYYSRVSSLTRSSTTSSTLTEDCASNATLVTNASPFNSQQALITDKNRNKNNSNSHSHYYAENLRHENQIKNSRIYNPLNEDLKEYTQLEPLVAKDRLGIDNAKIVMGSQIQLEEKDNGPSNPPRPTTIRAQKTSILTQVLAALTVSLGSMVVGFSCSYTSPALPSMNATAPFEFDEQISSWIGSVLPLAALFGGIVGGPLIEYLGRRNTILATAFPFIGAYLLIAMANTYWLVLAGRALCGLCVGIASLSLPVYLGETIQPEVRGTLGLLPTAFGNIGILICFVAGRYLDWSYLAFLGACLPVPYLLLMFLIPETPRWYISKGRTKRARKSLEWLRGKNADVTEELGGVEKTHVESERNSGHSALEVLLQPKNMKPLAISLGLMFFQQLSGINAVIFYTVEIFKSAGSSIESNLSTIIVGIVNFASTFVATALIDRLGRKILLYISSAAMIVTLATLGFFFYFKEHNYEGVSAVGWLPLVSFVIYVIGFSLGFGPVPWLMMGEILPAKIRGPAASIATGFNWSCTFIVTKTFKDIIGIIGASGTFFTFAIICVAGLVFVIILVPETRGRSLEEIERRLTGPVRRMSAIANMKPVPTGC
ncbi:facilitated trehalose transporter Tret1 isoform X2 [Diachasma alloeum]|uniref:facilitated trehalose transporter Tret1 isoform X2 n=1 Tax=Diachasma alloeum TaxID=454923 RepID=UPI0007384507|nr:facilitated trehalose transporter Tret1 isoform X2 [Diachasma alloeum]